MARGGCKKFRKVAAAFTAVPLIWRLFLPASDNSVDLDLFGDPIPDGFGKRGRPPHVATDRNRNKVMVLLAVGWLPGRIAAALGITEPTLRKHYFFELRSRSTMLDRLKAAHLTTLLDQMRSGNVQAIKEMGRIIDRIDAAQFGLGHDASDDDESEPPRRLGKKEAAQADAERAGEGSLWGNDLRVN